MRTGATIPPILGGLTCCSPLGSGGIRGTEESGLPKGEQHVSLGRIPGNEYRPSCLLRLLRQNTPPLPPQEADLPLAETSRQRRQQSMKSLAQPQGRNQKREDLIQIVSTKNTEDTERKDSS